MNEIINTDFWEIEKNYEAICCTTNSVVKGNGNLVMGRGIAKDFAVRFPKIPLEWGVRVSAFNSEVDPLILLTSIDLRRFAVYFQTKRDWKDKSDSKLIYRSMVKLGEMIIRLDINSVLLPRPGCSNGGLSWEEVKNELIESFDFRRSPYDRITFIGKE